MQSGELPEGLGHGTTLGQQYRGSPKDIFAQLPRELRITVEDPLEGRVVRHRSVGSVHMCRGRGCRYQEIWQLPWSPLQSAAMRL